MNPKKGRKQWEKEGRYQYILRQINAIKKDQQEGFAEVNAKLRVLTNGLAPVLEMDKTYLIKLVCKDEIDEVLLEHLLHRGSHGTTPNEAAQTEDLSKYKIKPYQITRRLQRMNTNAKKELNETIAYTLHRRWHVSKYAKNILTGDENKNEPGG